jgi:stage III sporulation protein AF
MQWFNDWLKMVITIVMFAAFIDLLLPSSKMQRYVKTVLSLFILLTLLSPVLDLFRSNWNVDKLLAEAEVKHKETGLGRLSDSSNGSLQAIQEQGSRLKDAQNQQAVVLAEKQIAEAIKESIRVETAYEAQQVDVLTSNDSEGNPYIKNISIVMHDKATAVSAPTEESKPKSIAAVKPVQIQIQVGGKDSQTTDGTNEDTPALIQAKAEVKKLISRNWSVPSDRVDIRVAALPSQSMRR